MKNLQMFCISLEPNHYNFIKKLEYIPVGLGKKNFDNLWLRDRSGENISYKNKHYGEYTYHYWIWKNYLNKLEDKWIGFCQYRKFWSKKDHSSENINLNTLSYQILREIPHEYNKYESILGIPIFINQFKPMKFIKKGLKIILRKPNLFINKNRRNINFHFDLMHGANNLNRAIDLLDKKNQNDFRKFVNTETSFNPHNMFICKSKEILFDYYETIFPWLEKCEKEFGFNLEGYGLKRIYGFLAERYMSYWFRKYTKFKIIPIVFKDLSDFKNN